MLRLNSFSFTKPIIIKYNIRNTRNTETPKELIRAEFFAYVDLPLAQNRQVGLFHM